MIRADRFPVSVFVKYRFCPQIYWLEEKIVDLLALFLLGSDRVEWTKRRFLCYRAWVRGVSLNKISNQYNVPKAVLKTWQAIWESYYEAFK